MLARYSMVVSLFAIALAGCDASGPALATMRIGNKSFHIEVAKTDAAMEKGLMERDSMPADHGMIFVFSDEDERGFWMKNTRFPLDILFLNTAGKVVSIRQMQAYDRTITHSNAPARYAIELNLGAADSSGVKVGDLIALPPEATSK